MVRPREEAREERAVGWEEEGGAEAVGEGEGLVRCFSTRPCAASTRRLAARQEGEEGRVSGKDTAGKRGVCVYI
jgi:hypothetical protein